MASFFFILVFFVYFSKGDDARTVSLVIISEVKFGSKQWRDGGDCRCQDVVENELVEQHVCTRAGKVA